METDQNVFVFEGRQLSQPNIPNFKFSEIRSDTAIVFQALSDESNKILTFNQLYIVYLRLLGLRYEDIMLHLQTISCDKIKIVF